MPKTYSMRALVYRASAAALPAVAALALMAAPAAAQDAKVVATTLTCEGQGTVGFIVGSKEQLTCTFKSAGGKIKCRNSGSTTFSTAFGSASELPSEHLGGSFSGVSAKVAAKTKEAGMQPASLFI